MISTTILSLKLLATLELRHSLRIPHMPDEPIDEPTDKPPDRWTSLITPVARHTCSPPEDQSLATQARA